MWHADETAAAHSQVHVGRSPDTTTHTTPTGTQIAADTTT